MLRSVLDRPRELDEACAIIDLLGEDVLLPEVLPADSLDDGDDDEELCVIVELRDEGEEVFCPDDVLPEDAVLLDVLLSCVIVELPPELLIALLCAVVMLPPVGLVTLCVGDVELPPDMAFLCATVTLPPVGLVTL